MDEASERGRAGEIDLGVGHTEVSARDGSGEPLRGMTEKAKRRKPRTSATQAPSSHTRTPPLLWYLPLCQRVPRITAIYPCIDVSVSQLSTQLRQGQGHEQLIFTFASAELMPNS